MSRPLRLILVMLLLVAVFDPADLLTHMKLPLFVFAWIIVPYSLLRFASVDIWQWRTVCLG